VVKKSDLVRAWLGFMTTRGGFRWFAVDLGPYHGIACDARQGFNIELE